MGVYHLRTEFRDPDAFCRTPAAAAMLDVLEAAIMFKCLGVIVGEPGVGKTTTLRWYADMEGAPYCTMTPAEASMSGALRRVGEALRIGPWHRGAAARALAICNELRSRRPRVLLIDEAQHLEDKALDELRCIHDETGVPVVFVGNESLRARTRPGAPAAFAQLVSRVGPRCHVTGSPDNMEALARHSGMTEPKALALIRKVCAGKGGMRVGARLLGICRDRGEFDHATLERAALALGSAL